MSNDKMTQEEIAAIGLPSIVTINDGNAVSIMAQNKDGEWGKYNASSGDGYCNKCGTHMEFPLTGDARQVVGFDGLFFDLPSGIFCPDCGTQMFFSLLSANKVTEKGLVIKYLDELDGAI
jgi:hypothetical protein